MGTDDSHFSSARESAVDASWLVREMARAAEEAPSQAADERSVAEAIDQCAELLSRFWPVEDGNSKDCTQFPSTPITIDAEPGTRLGRFEVRRALGHGGFGVVLLVYDARLNREAALKIPRPEVLLSRPLREQFLREAQSVAALDHPGIVPIFEIGEIGPVGYILSAYCKGATLLAWLREQGEPLSPQTAARIVQQLAEAVQHAHARGILHRDIKPSNVLLEPLSEVRGEPLPFVPRLSDFGLAKRLDQAIDSGQPRMVVGTPRYMAPEQAAGDEGEIGVHTDVYALGAVLFEMLTGQPPFVGQSDRETLRKIQEEELSSQALPGSQVPRDLAAITRKCLQKQSADRYASAGELADDLQHFLAGEPVTARPLHAGQRFSAWCRRRPMIATLALGLIVAVVSGAGAAGWEWYRAERHLAEAEVQATLAQANLVEAENAILDLAWIFEESALWAPESGTFRDLVNTKLTKYLEGVTSQHDESQPKSPILAATFSFSARHAGLAGDTKTADRNFRLAVDLWRQLVAQHPDNASYQRGLSLSLYNFSRFEVDVHRTAGFSDGIENERQFYRNLRDDPRFVNWSLHDFAAVVLERGDMLFGTRRGKLAVEAYEIGQIAVEVLLEQAPDDPKLLFRYGQYLLRTAKEKRRLGEGSTFAETLRAATSSFERALKQSPRLPELRVELAEAYRIAGVLARDRKEYVEAERTMISAINLLGSVLDEHPRDVQLQRQLAAPTRELAYIQLSLDKEEDALNQFARCRELWRPARIAHLLLTEDQKALAMACHDHGKLAQKLNRPEIARAAFAEGVEVFRHKQTDAEDSGRNYSGKPKQLVAQSECHFYLGRHQMAAGEVEAAEANFQAAIDLLAPFVKRPNPNPMFKDIYAKSTAKLEELRNRDVTPADATIAAP